VRILVFSHYYTPEVNAPATRTSEHAKAWTKAGHQVTVVTCAPNHPSGKLYGDYRNRLFQREQIDGVEVIRVWTLLAANRGFVRRIASYLSYLVSAAAAVPRLKRPDIILSTSPQFFCGLAGIPARRLLGVPWVLEIRDLWPESIVEVGAMKHGPAIRFLEHLERHAYRSADHVVSVTDGFVPHISERRQRDGISVLKNGVNLSLFSKREASSEGIKKRFGLEGRFVAAYVGTHGMAHGLHTILDVAHLLRDDPRIGFLLVGDGAEREALQERCRSMKLPNVHIAGQLPRNEMPDIWSATDASLILLRKSDTFKKVLPSKMFEAMAMECPIVLGVEGEAKLLLEAAGAGIAVEPENAHELAGAIRRLRDDPRLARRLGRQGRAYGAAHFDRDTIAMRYLDLLRTVAHQRGRREC
jgi:glycosyltransferase involved in cell wall biosynthesis